MRKLAVAVIVLMLSVVPEAAEASWSRPRPVERSDWIVGGATTSMATARNGAAIVAWSAFPEPSDGTSPPPDVVHVRRISPTGQLGSIRTLSGPDTANPIDISVALDDDGDALVTWGTWDSDNIDNCQVWARRLSRDGVAGPLVRVSTPGVYAGLPVAALTPRGQGAIEFRQGRSNSWVLHRFSRSSRVGHRVDLDSDVGANPRLVATRDGDFVTATTDGNGDLRAYRLLPDNRLRTRRISPDTAWSYGVSDIGADRNGTAYFTYAATSPDASRNTAEFVRTWGAGGRLGRARRITPRTHNVLVSTSRTDLQGDTEIAWTRQTGSVTTALYARIWRRDGSLGPIHDLGPMQPLEPYGVNPPPKPGLAVDDDGDAVVVWSTEPDWGHYVAWGRRIHRDGSLGGRKVMVKDHARAGRSVITPKGAARVLMMNEGGGVLWLTTGP